MAKAIDSLSHVFVVDCMGLASVNFTQFTLKAAVLCEIMHNGDPFRVTEGQRFWYRSKTRMRRPVNE